VPCVVSVFRFTSLDVFGQLHTSFLCTYSVGLLRITLTLFQRPRTIHRPKPQPLHRNRPNLLPNLHHHAPTQHPHPAIQHPHPSRPSLLLQPGRPPRLNQSLRLPPTIPVPRLQRPPQGCAQNGSWVERSTSNELHSRSTEFLPPQVPLRHQHQQRAHRAA
jgi:hypothetical protein